MPAFNYNHIHKENHISLQRQLKVFKRIVLTILFLAVVMLLGMIFGTMEDQVNGIGSVAGIREYDLKALVSARIIKIHRHEGEEVAAGEILAEFDSRDQRALITRLGNELEELDQSISVKEHELELLRRDPLPSYYRHTKLELDEARERYARTRHELEVYTKLFEQKVTTRKEFLRVELDNLSARMTVQRLEEDWKKLEDGLATEIIAHAEEELKLLRRRRESKSDEIAMAERQLEDYVLRAPDAGILTDIPPRPGGYYEKGEVVVKFAANQNKKVVGLIDEKQIFKVAPGQPVRIYCNQYNYLDYGYFDGKVEAIYQLPVQMNGGNYYPVKILLTREPQPLKFGSKCEVTIITGRERIIFALLGIKSQGYLARRGLSVPRAATAEESRPQQPDEQRAREIEQPVAAEGGEK